MTVTIPAWDLARTLRLAATCTHRLDHGGHDTISIEAGGGILTATGARPDVVGHARCPYADGDLPDSGVIINAAAARRLARTLDRRLYDNAVLTVEDGHLRVRAHTASRHPIDITIPIETAPWLRVDYRPLLDAVPAGTTGTGEPVFFTPGTLAVFADISRILGPAMCRWTILGPGQPVRVEVSDVMVMLIGQGLPTGAAHDCWPIPVGVPVPEPAGAGAEARS